jgi:exodeoxyribonuclease V alpha subunit
MELLSVDKGLIEEALVQLSSQKKIVVDNRFYRGTDDTCPPVYPAPLFFCERAVALKLNRIIGSPSQHSIFQVQSEINCVEKRLSITLAPAQKTAVETALSNKALVITGGPGTGKTTIVNVILQILGRFKRRILLSAPTGRAAKRLTETSGYPAKTIHRLLEYSYKAGGFQRNDERPLFCDVLIVDESSMIDITLMHHLIKAIPDDAVFILVGDVNQLPSVGPGNVLTDIIESGVLPVVTLNEIFRQAGKSKIIVNAHKINCGEFPSTSSPSPGRSEERRVGKECRRLCRSRWSPYH